MAIPKFFGLDIGNHSIKLVEIKNQGTQSPEIVHFAVASTPEGVIGSENKEKQKELAESIKELVSSTGTDTRNVALAIPESQIFSKIDSIPFVEESKIQDSVYWLSKKVLPISPDESKWDWMVIGERESGSQKLLDILLVSASNTLVERYVNIARMAGLEPVAIETEGIASVRAVAKSYPHLQSSVVIVDIGSQSTVISIMNKSSIIYSTSLVTGSDAVTRSLTQSFSLSWEQAEEYKKTYGMDPAHFEGKITDVIKPIIDSLMLEVSKSVEFFKQQYPDLVPSKILLAGEASLMPGLIIYLARGLNIEVELANPALGLSIDEKYKATLSQHLTGFVVSIGLALKSDF